MPVIKGFPPSNLVSPTIRITDRDFSCPTDFFNQPAKKLVPYLDSVSGYIFYVTEEYFASLTKKKPLKVTCEILDDSDDK